MANLYMLKVKLILQVKACIICDIINKVIVKKYFYVQSEIVHSQPCRISKFFCSAVLNIYHEKS